MDRVLIRCCVGGQPFHRHFWATSQGMSVLNFKFWKKGQGGERVCFWSGSHELHRFRGSSLYDSGILAVRTPLIAFAAGQPANGEEQDAGLAIIVASGRL